MRRMSLRRRMGSRELVRILCMGFRGMLVAGAIGSGTGHAQPYPNRPVRFVAPYPAGGSSDLVARVVAQKLSESLGRQFVVDNRSGGGGITGTELVARATADGHTLLLGNIGPLAITVPLTKQLGYDPRTDFAPARTPAAIIDRLNADVKRALDLPDVKARFTDLGIEAAYSTPAQYGAFVRAEVERFTRIVQQLGLKPE